MNNHVLDLGFLSKLNLCRISTNLEQFVQRTCAFTRKIKFVEQIKNQLLLAPVVLHMSVVPTNTNVNLEDENYRLKEKLDELRYKHQVIFVLTSVLSAPHTPKLRSGGAKKLALA